MSDKFEEEGATSWEEGIRFFWIHFQWAGPEIQGFITQSPALQK